jgi:hypothetical protein
MPLPADRRQLYLGKFAAKQTDLRLVCRLNMGGQLVVDLEAGKSESRNRIIHYLGNNEFFPAGVPSVRFRFVVQKEAATSVTIRGSVPEVTLQSGG